MGDSSSNVRIGALPFANTGYFNGKIDEVRIYNRVLGPEEIKASYNAGINRLYHNFTNLPDGVYSYRAYAQNLMGNVNQTETRTLTRIAAG
ncbi:Concanavalin A-like lectin/glucanases superfamily protein [uncultured archaeon]|nr:Concanavalin A-like lectin/glucanases superfamily protein [uncultured archaeon]